jgi:hypothetical protein
VPKAIRNGKRKIKGIQDEITRMCENLLANILRGEMGEAITLSRSFAKNRKIKDEAIFDVTSIKSNNIRETESGCRGGR